MKKKTKYRFGKPIYRNVEKQKKLRKKLKEQREQRKKEAKKIQFRMTDNARL